MSEDSKLSQAQSLRAIALREANYYFGFTAGIPRASDLGKGEPTIRAREVLGLAEVFEAYLFNGTQPEVVSG